jgi:hypothetical protein
MELNINFSEVDAPSAKQIDLVQEICLTLHLNPPEYDRKEYSLFIDLYLDEYNYERRFER